MRILSLGVRSAICLLALQNIACVPNYGQAPIASPQITPANSSFIPLSHVYWHFLMYQHHLDQEAAQNEKQGKSGVVIRSLLQTKLGMSDQQFEPIHVAAAGLSAAMDELNTRIRKKRDEFIRSRMNQTGPLTAEQDALHSALQNLDKEREEIMTRQMDQLDNEIAAGDRITLQKFLTDNIATKIHVLYLRPAPGSPSKTAGSTGDSGVTK